MHSIIASSNFPETLEKTREIACYLRKELLISYKTSENDANKKFLQIKRAVLDLLFIICALEGLGNSWKDYKSRKKENFLEGANQGKHNFFFFLNKKKERIIAREFSEKNGKKTFPVIAFEKTLRKKCPLCKKRHPVIDCEYPSMKFGGKYEELEERVVLCLQLMKVLRIKNGRIHPEKSQKEQVLT